jgi:type IV secretory pathway VirB4 component
MPKEIQKKSILPSTQKYLDIAEIRSNVVIMKDGSLRAVLLVSSINFSLKSVEEQQAIIGEYVNFLNFIDFPMEIVVQSRKLNIDKYLAEMKAKEKTQTNELLRLQTAEYIQYISELVELGDIMSKKFYITVPYVPGGEKREGFFTRLRNSFSLVSTLRLNEKMFEEYNKYLETRVGRVTSALSGMGLSVVQLDTQALIELFYNTYNLDIYNQQKLASLDKMQVEA